jgi:hypothetical protein
MSTAPADSPPAFQPSAYRLTAGQLACRQAVDLTLDAYHCVSGVRRRLDRLASATPVRDVLVLSIYGNDEPGSRARESAARLSRTRHRVRFAYGCRDPEPDPRLRRETIATGLDGPLFDNLNRVLALTAGWPRPRWTVVHGSDAGFPRRWLDRFIALCEAFDFAIAGPANTWRSFASYEFTRRSRRWLVRETGFVEAGPVFAMRDDAAAELIPFDDDVGQGWGLDFHWPYVAAERGWRLGIVDVTPIKHVDRPPGASYSAQQAAESGRRWLERHPFVEPEIALRTLATYGRIPRPGR